MEKKGHISVNTGNIFPIIKKSLYSNQEVFLRELVSNAVDATQKLNALASIGEFKGETGDTSVRVKIDKEKKTITISDRGIGMTGEEIDKYINQIAFSGATEFMEQYREKTDSNMIGAFGLGFYSAFMVADSVEIDSLSFKDGAAPVRWTCDGSTEFEIGSGQRTDRGSDVILHVSEDALDYLETWKLREILRKYCRFLPVPIQLEEEVINATVPLWTKKPLELGEEDYQKFYEELYPLAEKPLFHIHLNVDYPFNLTGILYFPKLKAEFEPSRNKIQLYSRQVFITDSVEDIVPDYLRLLHGVLDSPDIPLNVSRSFLQTDSNVRKINSHISKKVADKLAEMYRDDAEGFRGKWEHLELFVKYGMISDEKFAERSSGFCLYTSTNGDQRDWEAYQKLIEVNQRDKDGNLVVLYTSDPELQHAYVQAATRRGYDVLKMGSVIDSHFLNHQESKLEKVRFKRVDSEPIEQLIPKEQNTPSVLSEAQETELKDLFSQTVGDEKRKVTTATLSADDLPVMITRNEFMRRMNDMAATGGHPFGMGQMPETYDVVLNTAHPHLLHIAGCQDTDKKQSLIRHSYDLALLAQGMLKGAELSRFMERSLSLVDA
jgi:molecular chaperone HtpG